jgi:hypothetical protein
MTMEERRIATYDDTGKLPVERMPEVPITVVAGAEGPAGEAGPQGPQGPQGLQGLPGAVGQTGLVPHWSQGRYRSHRTARHPGHSGGGRPTGRHAPLGADRRHVRPAPRAESQDAPRVGRCRRARDAADAGPEERAGGLERDAGCDEPVRDDAGRADVRRARAERTRPRRSGHDEPRDGSCRQGADRPYPRADIRDARERHDGAGPCDQQHGEGHADRDGDPHHDGSGGRYPLPRHCPDRWHDDVHPHVRDRLQADRDARHRNVAARVFVLSWISDGTLLYEVSRTAAMPA